MRRVVYVAVVLVLLAGAVAGFARVRWGDAGWYFRTDPEYRLRIGQEALRHDNLDRVEAVANALDAAGHAEHAALLRADALYQQGKALADQGIADRAKPMLYRAVVELNKIKGDGALRTRATLIMGEVCLYMQRPLDAEDALKEVLRREPDNVEAHRALAVAYYDLGAMAPALRHFMRVVELDPADGRSYRTMGLICKDLGQYEEACKDYEKALAGNLYNQSPRKIRREWAECLLAEKRYADVLQVLEPLETDPEDEAARAWLRGEALWALGRGAEARDAADKGLALYGHDVPLLVLRAKIGRGDGDNAKAIELLERALAIDRHDFNARYELVLAYRATGQTKKADEEQRLLDLAQQDVNELSRLSKAAADRPWDREPREKLAELYDRLGKPEQAAHWRRAATRCVPPPKAS